MSIICFRCRLSTPLKVTAEIESVGPTPLKVTLEIQSGFDSARSDRVLGLGVEN